MLMRIGKVTNIYPTTGKIKVMYEDEKCASLPLAMLTMNREYSMPAVGDKVVTMHMENGSSKGFVLGTYYGGGMQPKANSGYRKDFGGGAYAISGGGAYLLNALEIVLKAAGAGVSLSDNASILGTEALIGSAAPPEDGAEAVPDGYLKITPEEAELKSVTTVKLIGDGGSVEITANGEAAKVTLDEETVIEATSITVKADDISLQCAYGTVTVEDLMKRMERIEDKLGLPHTI